MHLKNIKLSGFKSFVDSTTIPIRNQLNAIVGPNGCGKSNVVDAIRWVIGEGSPKQLRGQSMADVIFNGASSRKPVGKAVVELFFDNSAGKIAGEYARYSEIAIRREVQRDGQSEYFINNVACRRRDIIDIFLGTGLGPRSYAIIEQGMISRLIEAKPDEMRQHIEEVAGISQYKDRRRETENRMRRTQENLDRVKDIQEELARQLRHLKRQANAAERYKELKQEERQLQAEIKGLQWQELKKILVKLAEELQQQLLQQENLETQRNHFITELDKSKVIQAELLEQHQKVQKRYYGVGPEIARIEQQIKHTQQQLQRWQSELDQAEELWQELTDNSIEQQQQIEELTRELNLIEPRSEEIKQIAGASQQHLVAANERMQKSLAEWERYQAEASSCIKEIEIARNNISHYQQQLHQLNERLQRIQTFSNNSQLTQLHQETESLVVDVDEMSEELELLQHQLNDIKDSIIKQRQENQSANIHLQETYKAFQELQARKDSLEILQQTVLQGKDEQTKNWLVQQQLQSHTRLGKAIRVQPGWELAVESVLGGYFDAVCVDDITQWNQALQQLTTGTITLIDRNIAGVSENYLPQKVKTLLSQVSCDWPLFWLANIYIADDLDSAVQLRLQLSEKESVITKEGIWLGKNWLRVAKKQDQQDSILLRERELEQLSRSLLKQQQLLKESEDRLKQGENQLSELEIQRDQSHQAYQQVSRQFMQLQGQLSAKQSRFEELQQQQQRFSEEQVRIAEQIAQLQAVLEKNQIKLEQALLQEQALSNQKQVLLNQRQQCQLDLDQARTRAQQDQQRADELEIRLSANQNQLALLKQTIMRDQRQLTQLSEKKAHLTEQLQGSDEPLIALQNELQSLLNQQIVVEKELHQSEAQLQEHQQQLEYLESQRDQLSRNSNEMQGKKQKIEIEQQAIMVRQTTLEERLREMEFTLDGVLSNLPESANIQEMEQRAGQVTDRIQRLGPINLAAIDECQQLTERKEYLDKQQQDLQEALEILQTAIRKIDHETRSRFSDTYETLNQCFQKIFPQIFGGGRGILELTEEDLLTTGIVVRAQPPGKRNTTIHMLSGGEKALTAIALVFAIFELNPAPFCVLDEVDAPLDDLNVGRFCQVVKEMSKKTQFIIISHNKLTIEIADHLMGVTMQEAGISRLVSVDMEEAIAMAEA